MGVKFVLIVNKQGQTKLSRYYDDTLKNVSHHEEKISLEGELSRKCLKRIDKQCSFIEYEGYRVVYKRYASLFFIAGIDNSENELAVLEFIHHFVETLDQYFKSICELDVMYNLERVHIVLDEMISNGHILETAKQKILEPLVMMANA
eukprot:TRINITY_DN7170_c0_g2_i1.p1 TRINITY_DN7170_c0_g2~~TRINITY_DN7170_c0_g2_i1.p1  ORF type:complete len:148 (+),score=4.19 TRINITY_DN7170_c0_g2_i1:109-552(+)